MTLQNFLYWMLTGAGVGVAVPVLLMLPYVDEAFGSLSYNAKRLTVLLLSFALPLAVYGLGVWRGYVSANDEQLFQSLVAGFTAFSTSQVVHLPLRANDKEVGA